MKDYLISIIIPAYNSECYIDCTISSVVNQTYKNIEIIIVNDGSTDGTLGRLTYWKNIDNRIKIYSIQNQGVSQARNYAISKATGQLLLFVDSDDIINAQTVEIMLRCYMDEKHLVVCGFQRFESNLKCNFNENYLPNITQIIGKPTLLQKKRSGYYSCGILYEKKIIDNEEIKFDKELENLEDVVWNSVYLSYVKKIVYVNLPLYKYRINPNSITSKSVNAIYQAKCHYKAYNSIKNEVQKRKFGLIQKNMSRKIKLTCLNGLCGELFHAKITVIEFLNQLSNVKMPTKYEILFLKMIYSALIVKASFKKLI